MKITVGPVLFGAPYPLSSFESLPSTLLVTQWCVYVMHDPNFQDEA